MMSRSALFHLSFQLLLRKPTRNVAESALQRLVQDV
jgi:hypothetical protein